MSLKVLQGDCREVLKTLPDKTFNTCVTSPPYWGLRDYGEDNQLGLEETPQEYVANLVEVFREVRRVLRDDGTVWLNLGDSYSSGGRKTTTNQTVRGDTDYGVTRPPVYKGIKPKDLVGIPWRAAFALQEDGWYLRQDIIWNKPNPMPESVQDRCTKSHEYIFLLSKKDKYYFDNEAIKEQGTQRIGGNVKSQKGTDQKFSETKQGLLSAQQKAYEKVNKRSVWTVTTKPYKEAHFATYPPDLIEPCILAGCPEEGHVLDPFGGAGTTGLVADRLGRNATLIELNKSYADIMEKRLRNDNSLFLDLETT
jgi:DNA modification methylase